MKQDYLWNKTGSDPEIENLENALAAFRYRENAPPVLPAKVVPFKKTSARRSFRFAYAVAACAAFAMIGSGFWYEISNNQVEIQDMLVAAVKPENPETPKENPIAVEIQNPAPPKIETAKREIPARKFVKTAKIVSREVSPKPKKIENTVSETSSARLTKEEKYAYDQLMLALSITGSKLKMVKDKVEGIDDEPADAEKGR